MKGYLQGFTVAVVTTALLIPLVRLLALRLGAVSRPGGRNIHSKAIPRLGGVAMCGGFLASFGFALWSDSSVFEAFEANETRTLVLLLGSLLMCGVGFVDDTRRIPAQYKLYAQIIVAVLAYSAGFGIHSVKVPIIGEVSMGVFALPITILWVVGIINAVNLIDGLDGLAAGVAFFAAITNFTVALLTHSPFPATIMASLMGCVLGFLFFNFNPARIFMGDSGSYFLGFVLATTGLVGAMQKTSTAVSILVPVLALGVPIFDTIFSMVRRYLERRPMFAPDRGHLHHRLLDMGLTQKRAVLVLYGVSVTFTLAAVGIALDRSWYAGLGIAFAAAIMAGLVRFVGYFEYLLLVRRQRSRLRSRHTELLRKLLPEVPSLLSGARSETDVWNALRAVQDRSEIACIELMTYDGSKYETVFAWANEAFGDPNNPDLISTEFPLGPEDHATHWLGFRWQSDHGDVSPQCEVLLQIVADITAATLTRLGSPHGPRVPEPAGARVPARTTAPRLTPALVSGPPPSSISSSHG